MMESVVPSPKRTHIDHLLDRKGITTAQHKVLKAAELARLEAAENAARALASQVINKAKD
jgi:hypothetical protein